MNENYIPQEVKTVLEGMEAGLMFYHFLKEEHESDEEGKVAFIIKEEQFRLNKLKSMVNFQLVSVGTNVDNVLVIDLMIRFKDITDTIYECCINAKGDIGDMAVKSLATKSDFYIQFFNEKNELHRQIIVPNGAKKDFKKFQYTLSEWLPWSMEEFDLAKAKFLKSEPIDILWSKHAKQRL